MMRLVDRFVAPLLGPELAYALFRVACYGSVSGVALLVDLLVYRFALLAAPYAAMAAACGFLAGCLTHYLVSSRIAFADVLTRRGAPAEAQVLGQFVAAGGTGLVVTCFVVWLVSDVLGHHPFVGKGVAVLFSVASVFTIMRIFVLGNFLARPARR